MRHIIYDKNDNAILSREEIEQLLAEAYEAGRKDAKVEYLAAKQHAKVAMYCTFNGEKVDYRCNEKGGAK